MREKFQRFMSGRYGTDNFNKFLLFLSVVFLVISLFGVGNWLYFIALAVLIYAYFRMFSRNVTARYQENEKYLRITGKARSFLSTKKQHFAQRKTYRFYKCPGCGQTVRVPKGKGHIRITCPKCRTEFEKTT